MHTYDRINARAVAGSQERPTDMTRITSAEAQEIIRTARANSTSIDLGGADLRWADLRGATGLQHWLQLSGLPSGEAWYGPTERGWLTTVGCYRNKPLADLKARVAQDEDWPEARGEEVARRRPGLLLWIAMCEEWERLHPTAVAEYQAGLEEGRALRARIQAETRMETPDAQ